jgi:coiled-coil domain-containing protein 12
MVAKFEDLVAETPLETNGAEDPIVSIAPKKPNSDLRRDVAKKLEKLERRTQRAIIELMQEEERLRQAAAAEEYME